MTEQERRKIDEIYQNIINLLAQEGLTYKQVRCIMGMLDTHLRKKRTGLLEKSNGKRSPVLKT